MVGLIGDVVAHYRCGGSLDMWWLIGDVVANKICGDSLSDAMAHWRYGGSFSVAVSHLRCGCTIH